MESGDYLSCPVKRWASTSNTGNSLTRLSRRMALGFSRVVGEVGVAGYQVDCSKMHRPFFHGPSTVGPTLFSIPLPRAPSPSHWYPNDLRYTFRIVRGIKKGLRRGVHNLNIS